MKKQRAFLDGEKGQNRRTEMKKKERMKGVLGWRSERISTRPAIVPCLSIETFFRASLLVMFI